MKALKLRILLLSAAFKDLIHEQDIYINSGNLIN